MKLPRPPTQPAAWLAGVAVWMGALWVLSANSTTIEGVPPIPFLDKIGHFGYFFGGAGLLSGFFYCRRPAAPNWLRLGVVVVTLLAVIGGLDEFHQTFTPGRSGNDPWDWLADVLGSAAGCFAFKRFHQLLRIQTDRH